MTSWYDNNGENMKKLPHGTKTRIIRRDGGHCILCFSQQLLCVHHWTGNYITTEDKDLITLCGRCHSKLHSIHSSPNYEESPWWKMWERIVAKREDKP